jgi:MarR family transcriptional regulator, organic hydroperoxide resistance regulator
MEATDYDSEVAIDDYICRALYMASRAVTGLYRELLTDIGLTYPQYLVMRLLWQRGPARVKDLATTLQLDYGTLSPLLKRLEAAGLLHRTRRADDERSVEIAVTAAGQEMRAGAAEVPVRLTAAIGLDDHTTRDLLKTLQQLTTSVNRAASTPNREHGNAAA